MYNNSNDNNNDWCQKFPRKTFEQNFKNRHTFMKNRCTTKTILMRCKAG